MDIKKQLFVLSTMFLVSLVSCAIVRAATYYVDKNHPSASDSNPGTESLPWATITKACQTLQAGDTVYVKAGTYTAPGSGSWYTPCLNPANSGSSGQPITFQAHPGETVTIIPGSGSAGPLIGADQKDYIIWDGFIVNSMTANDYNWRPAFLMRTSYSEIRNCDLIWKYISTVDNHNCLFVEYANNCTIYNNSMHGSQSNSHNGACIIMYDSHNIIIEHNELYDARVGAYIKSWGNSNVIFRYNKVWNQVNYGILCNDTQPGFEIYQNIFINCNAAISFQNAVGNIRAWNNVCYNNIQAGIEEWWSGAAQNGLVWNNIIHTAGTAAHVKNSADFNDWDYNCYYKYNNFQINDTSKTWVEWKTQTGFDDVGSIFDTDPQFLNFTDFKLQPGSPCANAGIDWQDHDNDGNTSENIPMGCYITGNEIIGRTSQGQDSDPPAPPNGVKVVPK